MVPLPSRNPHWLRGLLAAAVLGGAAAAMAQPAPVPPVAQLEGRTLAGRPFTLASQRGKVVMVVFWSTACAVCRDTLPELRANYAGWRGKPFELVLVATDAQRQDVVTYEALLDRIVPASAQFPSLWRQEPGHRDGFGPPGQLPATFVIDREGRAVERFAGRIPAEAWDRVAELLP